MVPPVVEGLDGSVWYWGCYDFTRKRWYWIRLRLQHWDSGGGGFKPGSNQEGARPEVAKPDRMERNCASAGWINDDPVGLELPANAAFFPPAWTQTAWPQTLLINTAPPPPTLLPFLHNPGLAPSLMQQPLSQPSRGHLKASAAPAMISIPQGLHREETMLALQNTHTHTQTDSQWSWYGCCLE